MKLMIGDWVRFKEDYPVIEFRGVLAHITGIHGFCDIITADGRYNTVNPNWIEPIPLSDEILDKNFAKNGCQYFDESQDFQIEAYFGDVSEKYQKYVILYTDLSKIFVKKELQELQHALTLIGVEKEIEP